MELPKDWDELTETGTPLDEGTKNVGVEDQEYELHDANNFSEDSRTLQEMTTFII